MPRNKNKARYVPAFDAQTAVMQLPGRHACSCQASKHGLINNCLNCGRVVCEQEGAGPCLYCSSLVCTREQLSFTGISDDLQKAVAAKDRLLRYDATSAERTKVFDDQEDYFAMSNCPWLSEAEKQKYLKRHEFMKEQRRKQRYTVTLDFAGRRVLPAAGTQDASMECDEGSNTTPVDINRFRETLGDVGSGKVVGGHRKGFVPEYEPGEHLATGIPDAASCAFSRIQDENGANTVGDTGKCLSMHQPHALLLVEGVKQHEGRTWYTNHRGRLWIHAGGRQPEKAEVDQIHDFYRQHYSDPNLKLPRHYPTSALIGCVDVDDCLAQEEYRAHYPNGESASPYVLICSNFRRMRDPLPMTGQPKIFDLDIPLHRAAKRLTFNAPPASQ